MKTLSEVIADSVAGWDEMHASDPILKMVDTLTTEGRFDETTQVLTAWLQDYNTPALTNFVMAKVPVKVLNNFVYKQTGLDHQIIMDTWTKDAVFDAVKAAALKVGVLAPTVDAFVRKVRALSEKA